LSSRPDVVNLVFAGLGGQGVLTAAGIAAEAAFRSGFDVKQSEIHGMSQRGGFVTSDVRFGAKVWSPMAPAADFLVLFEASQLEAAQSCLRPGGALIAPAAVEGLRLPSRKSFNVALLGVLSKRLNISEERWLDAIRSRLPEKAHESSLRAFLTGAAA
jgi:indolepyruvate ferredoxin oxidoreductase beta subunit